MRLAWIGDQYQDMASLRHIFGTTERLLAVNHEIVNLPHGYYQTLKSRAALAEEIVRGCDFIVGLPDAGILQARERLGKNMPFLYFLHGMMPRGAFQMNHLVRHLRSNDIFVANSEADREIAANFFPNAQIRVVPFAFDETAFFPMGEDETRAVREEFGLGPDDKVLVYSGRMTLEKNLHTLLKVFAVVQREVPNSHLVIAGDALNVPFDEFGLQPVNLSRTLTRLVTKLEIPEGRVHFLGRVGAERLRQLYNVADVMVNLTLHHDENFGLAQVEAMACGAPVVGTNWGGLKDTILDGEVGRHVSTYMTPSGVKCSWWEAVNAVVSLLRADGAESARVRRRCREHVLANYSRERYRELLDSLVEDCVKSKSRPSQPLKLSRFGREYWCLCAPWISDQPLYLRGERSFQMYSDLITPYTGVSRGGVAPGTKLSPSHVVSLAAPLAEGAEGVLTVNDPLFPFDIEVPERLREGVRAAAQVLRERPVITAEELTRAQPNTGVEAALAWMLEQGLVLATEAAACAVEPAAAGPQAARPLFTIESVGHTTDVVVTRLASRPAAQEAPPAHRAAPLAARAAL